MFNHSMMLLKDIEIKVLNIENKKHIKDLRFMECSGNLFFIKQIYRE